MANSELLSRGHESNCKFRIAETCAVGIECDHGYDVCPICDPCTCRVRNGTKEDRLPKDRRIGNRDFIWEPIR